MSQPVSISGYGYADEQCSHTHAYLLGVLSRELDQGRPRVKKVFDLGCGNGSVAAWLSTRGYEVHGVDPSESGIALARTHHPDIDLRTGSAYDPLVETFGTFPYVISLEVVEHLYAPRLFARCVVDLLEPGGRALISTPYHGYLKNVALAVSGKLDSHFTALWDHGHIKFWSRDTIRHLLSEAGLDVLRIHRVGRIPSLAKSMMVVAEKPRRAAL